MALGLDSPHVNPLLAGLHIRGGNGQVSAFGETGRKTLSRGSGSLGGFVAHENPSRAKPPRTPGKTRSRLSAFIGG
jgi:hypothetical protein